MSSEEKQSLKKRRGRPPGSIKLDQAILDENKKGITKEPSEPNRFVELQFHHPTLWKRVFDVIKNQKSRYTRITFDKERVSFTSKGRHGRTTSEFIFVGKNMTRYYCEQPHTIYLQPDHVQTHMKKLNDKYTEIHFFLKKGFQSEKLFIVLKNCSGICEEVSINIEVNVSKDAVIAPIPEEIPYMIKFHIMSQTLKTVVKEYGGSVSHITFNKVPKKPIQITYDFQNNGPVSGTLTLPDNQNEEKLGENELFRWQVHLNLIQPILAFTLAREFEMRCHNNHPAIIYHDYYDHMTLKFMIDPTL